MQRSPLFQVDTESHTAGSGRWVFAVQATLGTPHPPDLPRSQRQECHQLFLQQNEETRFGSDIFEFSASIQCRYPALTCRFGAGKDERGRAAVPNLFVAGVHVDAVNGERLQTTDVSATLLHLPLYKGKFLSRRLIIREVSLRQVPVSHQQSVDGSIGHAKQIPPSPVGRPGIKEMRYWRNTVELPL